MVPRGMRGQRALLTNWEVQQILGCEEGDFSSSQNSHRWVPADKRISMAVIEDEKEL